MTGSPRIHTRLNATQLAALTKWCIQNDRSTSYAVSHAVTRFLGTAEPYQGDAGYKVMSRTTEANVAALNEYRGEMWRIVNGCVQRLLENDQA